MENIIKFIKSDFILNCIYDLNDDSYKKSFKDF